MEFIKYIYNIFELHKQLSMRCKICNKRVFRIHIIIFSASAPLILQ